MSNAIPQDEYFSWCIAHPGVSNYAVIDGVKIHYLEWPRPSNASLEAPSILLVHGFMGHAHWWDFVAPALAQDYRVLAMDLSGMGDSEYRGEYSLDRHVAEIAALIEHTKLTRLTLIGHSFGGRCTILTAYAHPHLMQRAIAIDSHVSFPDPERKRAFHAKVSNVKKRYPDFNLAKSRFRLVPEETGTPPIILDHIAGHSLKKDGDSWSWKFDDKINTRGPKPEVSDARALPLLKVPLDFICGEHSRVVSAAHAQEIAAAIPVGRAPVVIPAAYHHVPLGQPVALVATLRTLLIDNICKA